jgi:putative DNA primase/helicase
MSAQYLSEADRVRAALAVIPAEDYVTWVDMAFAVKHGLGDSGYEIWDEWSRSAGNYSERAARTTWRSARASGGKTLGTLFWLAQQYGFDLKASGASGINAVAGVSDGVERERWAREVLQQQEKMRARHAVAAREAVSIWRWARPVGPQHPYLVRKQIEPVSTLRELEAGELRTLLGYSPRSEEDALEGRVLMVPVWIADVLSTLELIDEQGRKSSLAGGAKSGGYWLTGPLPDGNESTVPILTAEGMATALSAHLATGWVAAASLSSGNLLKVTEVLRGRYPEAELLVLADLGPGQAYAGRAAAQASARLAVPAFASDVRIAGEVPSDFNDMAVLAGLDAVREALRDAAYRDMSRAGDVDLPPPDEGAWWNNERKEGGQMGRAKEKVVDGTNETEGTKAVPAAEVPEAMTRAATGDGVAGTTSRRVVGEPLYGLDDVPNEVKALAQHRFGAQIRMATPRESGGPYRGEVFNTEHYMIQEVATRSVVFHAKDRMEFVSDRLKWCDENHRLNGADVQIGYEGERPKVYPWDRARDQLERTVASLKKSAQELGLGDDLVQTLDRLRTKTWDRVRAARAAALEQSREHAAREPGATPDR